MRRTGRLRVSWECVWAALAGTLVLGMGVEAMATPPTRASGPSEGAHGMPTPSLKQHFGAEVARRLLRGGESANVTDDVLRGIDRAAALGTPEGVALLVQLFHDAHGIARSDARVMLAATRALGPFVHEPGVARALAEVALNGSSTPRNGSPSNAAEEQSAASADTDRRARMELVRGTAAIALARGGDERAVDMLVAAARGSGSGQAAARLALQAFPPIVMEPPPIVTAATVRLAVALGDLRALDGLLEASRSVLDAPLRAAALAGLGRLGDTRGIASAVEATDDRDPGVRKAATEALVDLGAPEAVKALARLIEDDVLALAVRGVELSPRVAGPEITGALAARIRVSSDRPLRLAAITALGERGDAGALTVLRGLLSDPRLAGDAAEAIARSQSQAPSEAWQLIVETLARPSSRRLGARMAALRGRVTGDVPGPVKRALVELSHATDGADRAVGLAALMLVGASHVSAPQGLADADVRVRRAVAMACEPTDAVQAEALLARLPRETDAATKLLLARGLAGASDAVRDADSLTLKSLLDRVNDADLDAPLAVLVLARRGDEHEREAVDAALASPDPLFRAHAARGLAASSEPSAIGRLADAYEAETDPGVRRSLVLAMAVRQADEGVPLRARALGRAANFDPDAGIRVIAARALQGLPPPESPSGHDAIWLRVMTDAGAAPSSPQVSGIVVRADGLAVPVLFDEDGYALLPAPPGPGRLRLAPRLGAYDPVHEDHHEHHDD